MEEKQIHDELSSIRSLMERSSKFISLSGLSGVLAGIYALIGAAFAQFLLSIELSSANVESQYIRGEGLVYSSPSRGGHFINSIFMPYIIVALLVLIASIGTGIILTMRKAKKKGQPIWGNTSKQLLFNMAVPLIAGGLFIIIMIIRGHYGVVASASLIFYGLSLLGASNFTFGDVKYLGILEIVLGLAAACLPGYGLYFWAMGFGVLHIIYGSIMYYKYDG